MQKKSDSEVVRSYLNDHPSVLDCLRLGVLNLSALARIIGKEKSSKNYSALLKALQRVEAKTTPNAIKHEKDVLSLVKDSKIRVHTETAALLCKLPDNLDFILPFYSKIRKRRGDIQLVEGEEVLVVVLHQDFLPEAKKVLKNHLKEVQEDLCQIRVIFDEKFQETSGVIAFILERLAQRGINVREVISGWTDLILLIADRDLVKCLEVLDS